MGYSYVVHVPHMDPRSGGHDVSGTTDLSQEDLLKEFPDGSEVRTYNPLPGSEDPAPAKAATKASASSSKKK